MLLATGIASYASSNGGVRALQPTRVPVILVNYADVQFKNTDFNEYIASVQKYFSDNSFGKYEPVFDVIGPVNLGNKQKYYGENDEYGYDYRADKMVQDACNLAEDLADFTKYDQDGDGKLDAVVIIYAGEGEEFGVKNKDAVWAYTANLEESDEIEDYVVLDGKTVMFFSAVPELQDSKNRDGIGTLIHEFAHILGLPNLCTTNGGYYKTLGDWDVMDHGSYNNNAHTPAAMSAYERFFLGWVEPILLDEPMNVRLRDLNKSGDCAIITANGQHNLNGISPDPREFYILENRQQEGWDKYLPGHGLMLTYIDYVKNKWASDEVNNIENHPCVDLIEADGSRPKYKVNDPNNGFFGKPKDLFPAGATEKKMFSNKMGFSGVKEQGGIITFDFNGGVDKCTVYCYTGANGYLNDPDKAELEETTKGAGIVLPKVTAKNGYTFLGWASRKRSSSPDAGQPGDIFYPMSDCTVYALFRDETRVWFDYTLKGVEWSSGAMAYAKRGQDFYISFKAKDGYLKPAAATCQVRLTCAGKAMNNYAFEGDSVVLRFKAADATDNIYISIINVREQKEAGCDAYKHEFKSTCYSGTVQDFSNYDWDVTIANDNTIAYDKKLGATFGSNNYPAGLVSLYTTETMGCAVAKVKVTASCGSQGDAVLSVYYAGNPAGETQYLTKATETYEFIVEKNQSGALEIRLENTKSAMYLKQIEISYVKLEDPTSQEPDIEPEPEDPTDPTDPTDPEKPEDPTDPTDPENPEDPGNEGIDMIVQDAEWTKTLIDGQLYIRHNGQIFNVLGTIIK